MRLDLARTHGIVIVRYHPQFQKYTGHGWKKQWTITKINKCSVQSGFSFLVVIIRKLSGGISARAHTVQSAGKYEAYQFNTHSQTL